ncbi:MAG: hypothetical protein K0Q79_110 [Flavipsychrobacter sp.]|jgi:hypothetical protein|nr:hypothetical protein [Flavipsychrobacter sp.]
MFAYNMYHMKIITTNGLISILTNDVSIGHQISRRHGILNSTKCIFIKNNLIYLFDVSENFRFNKKNGISIHDFQTEYKDVKWIYEEPIN